MRQSSGRLSEKLGDEVGEEVVCVHVLPLSGLDGAMKNNFCFKEHNLVLEKGKYQCGWGHGIGMGRVWTVTD
jgi:hypothetical protein